MIKEAEIIAAHKKDHDELTEAYYSKSAPMTKEQFDSLHGQIWDALDAELIANGYKNQPRDLKSEYNAASDKLAFIAEHLGLI